MYRTKKTKATKTTARSHTLLHRVHSMGYNILGSTKQRLLVITMIVAGLLMLSSTQIAYGQTQETTTNTRVLFHTCDKNTYFTINPGGELEVCLELTNPAPFPQDVSVYFRDGIMNAAGSRGCAINPSEGSERFQGFEEVVTIDALDTKQIYATKTFSVEEIGEQYGCALMEHARSDDNVGGVGVRMRYARPFTVFVAGDIDYEITFTPTQNALRTIAKNNILSVLKDDDAYIVSTEVANNGGLTETITYSGQITDTFGNVYEFAGTEFQLTPGSTRNIAITLEELPRYRLWFTAQLDITHEAIVGNIDPEYLRDELTQPHHLTATITFFVFPWWLLFVIIGIILLIIIIKKIYKHNVGQKQALLQRIAELEKAEQAKAEENN